MSQSGEAVEDDPSTQTGFLRGLWRALGDKSLRGYLPTTTGVGAYFRRGELWSLTVDESVASGDTVDVVISNPQGSGNRLRVVTWGVSSNAAGDARPYRGVDVTGDPAKIAPDAVNHDEDFGAEDAVFDAERGVGIIDPSNAVRIGGAVFFEGGQGQRRSVGAALSGFEWGISEGGTWGLRFTAENSGDISIHVAVSEFEKGRLMALYGNDLV